MSAAVPAMAILARTLGPDLEADALQLFDSANDREFLSRLSLQLEEAESIMLNQLPGIIETPAQQAQITALVARAYVVEREAERLRKERVAPLNVIVGGINGLFRRAFSDLLAKYGKGGDAERLDDLYRRMEAQKIQREKDEALRKQVAAAEAEGAALRKLAEAKSDAEHVAAMAEAEAASRAQLLAEAEGPREQVRGVKTAEGKVTYRKTWDFEVVDPMAVPRQYLAVDERALRAAVASGVREVPGISIFEIEARRRGI
jgi:hypothetical protein